MRWVFAVAVLGTGFVVQADQIEWFRRGHLGIEQIVIKYSEKKSLLFRNTNAFSSKFPARIGFFESSRPSPLYKSLKGLDPAAYRPQVANLWSGPHVAVTYFNGKLVPRTSRAQALIDQIIREEMKDDRWKFTEGNQVILQTENELTVEEWIKGKKVRNVARLPASRCDVSGRRRTCRVQAGMVHLP